MMILKEASAGVGGKKGRKGRLVVRARERDWDHRQSEELGGWSLTRSRRFVNIQFRSGLIANWVISFLVLTRSSFG
jgi:hypothetical protein